MAETLATPWDLDEKKRVGFGPWIEETLKLGPFYPKTPTQKRKEKKKKKQNKTKRHHKLG